MGGMILVDTSVWIGHIRAADKAFAELLYENRVLTHPFIIGELALGHLPDRVAFLGLLQSLPMVMRASDAEVLRLIERQSLAGAGIGYVEAHLLASTNSLPAPGSGRETNALAPSPNIWDLIPNWTTDQYIHRYPDYQFCRRQKSRSSIAGTS